MLSPIFYLYFILLGLGFCGSSAVIVYLLHLSRGVFNSQITKLIFFLHLSLVLEEVASIPAFYNYSLCQFMSFLFLYSGLANAFAMLLLTLSYRYLLLEDVHHIGSKIKKYSAYIIWGFPFIALIPFTTNSYGNPDGEWCLLSSSSTISNIWAWTIFDFWAYCALIASVVLTSHTLLKIRKIDQLMVKRFVRSVGLYIAVSATSFLIRGVYGVFRAICPNKIDANDAFILYFPVAISGILYFFVFLNEMRSLSQVEAVDKTDRNREFSADLPDVSYGIRLSEGGGSKVSYQDNRAYSTDSVEGTVAGAGVNVVGADTLHMTSWELFENMAPQDRKRVVSETEPVLQPVVLNSSLLKYSEYEVGSSS